jgi:hypothetical protein
MHQATAALNTMAAGSKTNIMARVSWLCVMAGSLQVLARIILCHVSCVLAACSTCSTHACDRAMHAIYQSPTGFVALQVSGWMACSTARAYANTLGVCATRAAGAQACDMGMAR